MLKQQPSGLGREQHRETTRFYGNEAINREGDKNLAEDLAATIITFPFLTLSFT